MMHIHVLSRGGYAILEKSRAEALGLESPDLALAPARMSWLSSSLKEHLLAKVGTTFKQRPLESPSTQDMYLEEALRKMDLQWEERLNQSMRSMEQLQEQKEIQRALEEKLHSMTQGTMGLPIEAPTTPQVSTRGSCSTIDPTEYSGQYKLLIDRDPPCIVVVGRVLEGDQTIHDVPLLPHHVRVIIDEVPDPQAECNKQLDSWECGYYVMSCIKTIIQVVITDDWIEVAYGQHHIRCLPKEREALIQFKAAIVDRYGMLSSWTTPDCCQWEGIRCTNLTAHIISLHLPGQYNEVSPRYIRGEIHKSLMELRHLQLRLDNNKLNGTISEDLRFPTELEELSLMSNSLKVSENWGSTYQLEIIELRSCKLGPLFPKWLEKQNAFDYLLISNNGISGTVPKWFWTKFGLSNWIIIDISCNNLQGTIPNLPIKNHYYFLSLASNQFVGHVPPFLRGSIFLDLSNNKFTNSSWFLCSSGVVETLYQLDLSNNKFSGQIPDCWTHFKSLAYLNMSQNNFLGEIPSSMGSFLELQVLFLRSNNLTGEIPSSLRNCTKRERMGEDERSEQGARTSEDEQNMDERPNMDERTSVPTMGEDERPNRNERP
ncbi:hypothetical protein LR48_Vigan10g111900 [Vigna angularis]|uniref:Leucine-rich repeat-containing N-terminal plant-type domain-containing protein n=1 Tax=Phaseolus angularis TaxID=3914 RepID=A0A0L9VJY3_PHAAN|nr:hypothetical protein LR48_Vigan10g111900 [Vigna angularis]